MAKVENKKFKSGRYSDISVEERIAKYNSAVKAITSSPEKTKQYLKSTGIYTKTGRLTRIYK